jgi:hypothetical protein
VSPDNKVKEGQEFTLTATVAPCGNHDGFPVRLFRRSNKNSKWDAIDKRASNDRCKVKFETSINKPQQSG